MNLTKINGRKIAALCEKRGITPYMIAKRSRMSVHGIYDIIAGKRGGIRFETLKKICMALNCRPEEIA